MLLQYLVTLLDLRGKKNSRLNYYLLRAGVHEVPAGGHGGTHSVFLTTHERERNGRPLARARSNIYEVSLQEKYGHRMNKQVQERFTGKGKPRTYRNKNEWEGSRMEIKMKDPKTNGKELRRKKNKERNITEGRADYDWH